MPVICAVWIISWRSKTIWEQDHRDGVAHVRWPWVPRGPAPSRLAPAIRYSGVNPMWTRDFRGTGPPGEQVHLGNMATWEQDHRGTGAIPADLGRQKMGSSGHRDGVAHFPVAGVPGGPTSSRLAPAIRYSGVSPCGHRSTWGTGPPGEHGYQGTWDIMVGTGHPLWTEPSDILGHLRDDRPSGMTGPFQGEKHTMAYTFLLPSRKESSSHSSSIF